ncbi:hypothetical protein L210DRAFT_502374 [Boletus edulis BED1]|uniref:Uncharacterized protein n=1 Tax=Boletus edulis BED1 TaxID=1328754 RepID=A0AAD4GCV3_BOLED|nr:hypothetical protein L210DRAFT_502374 [Boletus edulis BED1]
MISGNGSVHIVDLGLSTLLTEPRRIDICQVVGIIQCIDARNEHEEEASHLLPTTQCYVLCWLGPRFPYNLNRTIQRMRSREGLRRRGLTVRWSRDVCSTVMVNCRDRSNTSVVSGTVDFINNELAASVRRSARAHREFHSFTGYTLLVALVMVTDQSIAAHERTELWIFVFLRRSHRGL